MNNEKNSIKPPRYRLRSLTSSGRKVHSENDEDGTIEAIFQDIPPQSRYFVEFGIGPNWQDKQYLHGLEGNCVWLLEKGWRGLFMDGDRHPDRFSVRQEFITPLNVNSLLRKYEVPENVDLVSIDIDGQDYWIWMALDYRPAVVVIEYNSNFPTLAQSVTVPFDLKFRWDYTKYHGASLGALVTLARDKGYRLVHANGVNAFFVRTNILANEHDFDDEKLVVFVDRYPADDLDREWVDVNGPSSLR
jgi:hypothetical protein